MPQEKSYPTHAQQTKPRPSKLEILEVPFEKVKKATLKKGVAKKGELPNNEDEGQVIMAKGDDDEVHMLMAKYDDDGDWVYDYVHSYHTCRGMSLFTRVMTSEHERVTLLSGEEVVVATIKGCI